MNDAISDFVIRLKNASLANNSEVTSPYSKFRESLAKLLLDQHYIAGYQVNSDSQFKVLTVKLITNGVRVDRLQVVRISKPGRRVYAQANRMDKLILGQSTVIVSTPSGLMTAKQAKKTHQGGELICKINIV